MIFIIYCQICFIISPTPFFIPNSNPPPPPPLCQPHHFTTPPPPPEPASFPFPPGVNAFLGVRFPLNLKPHPFLAVPRCPCVFRYHFPPPPPSTVHFIILPPPLPFHSGHFIISPPPPPLASAPLPPPPHKCASYPPLSPPGVHTFLGVIFPLNLKPHPFLAVPRCSPCFGIISGLTKTAVL